MSAEPVAAGGIFLGLARGHAGGPGDPPFPQEKGRIPRTAAAHLRASGERSRFLALAGVRVEEEKRAKAAAVRHESDWSAEVWERKYGRN